jgi:alkylation response protein AidB-like acyl-CoA dehydrogenase
MSDYHPPLADIRFTLDAIVKAGRLTVDGVYPDYDVSVRDAVLDEAGRLAAEVIAPLNRLGDRQGARLENGVVRTTPGFADAYRQFAAGGWAGMTGEAGYGGLGLPHVLGVAVEELWQSANIAFGLCPILTHGAIEALSAHGSETLKRIYLPKLMSGAWTGTMNLTEPQAGSDVGALRSRAVDAGDGSYRITGQKIFITWGEHDCAENIVHLVLARLPEAPPGTRGISLFLVPKFLPNADGTLGKRNDLACVGLEHKLGIHGSPTCVMSFGDNGGATGFLIGGENKGMAAMFTMMNSARLNVGVQGVAMAERAWQKALAYAQERKQGKPARPDAGDAIIAHPDVRRMLFTIKSGTEAARAICLANAVAIDIARRHPDAAERAAAKAREELLTPISKAWSTDMAVRAASLCVQVHGGMGFIEETGAAQLYRDVRILPIYEGTNGIQAIDLVTRKLGLDGGAAMDALVAGMDRTVAELRDAADPALKATAKALAPALGALHHAIAHLRERAGAGAVEDVLAGATPFLELMGSALGGALLGKGALAASAMLAAGDSNAAFLNARIATARFFAENDAAHAAGLLPAVKAEASSLPLFWHRG